MKKTKFSRYFIFISFFTLSTILVVIIQKSYDNLMGPINQVQTTSYDKTISPQLDLEIIDEIEKKSINFNEFSLTDIFSPPESTGSSKLP
jgi:hypothetical protein